MFTQVVDYENSNAQTHRETDVLNTAKFVKYIFLKIYSNTNRVTEKILPVTTIGENLTIFIPDHK